MELPPFGLRLTKQFVVPPDTRPEHTQLALALPLLAPEGGRLTVKAGLSGQPSQDGTLELKTSGDLQWFTLSLGRQEPPLPTSVRVDLELVPDNSNTLLLLDTHRNYGRTEIQAPDGQMQKLPSECCAELLLLDPGTARTVPGAGHPVH
jgi:hypothetical protein